MTTLSGPEIVAMGDSTTATTDSVPTSSAPRRRRALPVSPGTLLAALFVLLVLVVRMPRKKRVTSGDAVVWSCSHKELASSDS